MKKITYTHLPRVNQEANNNLVTKKMVLSKKFKIKSLKITASCFFSSIIAISILGIANKSVAEVRNERQSFVAVMRLTKSGELLFIRRVPMIMETVKLPTQYINEKNEVDPEVLIDNIVGQIQYSGRPSDDPLLEKHLYPTTIVRLSGCREDGWCSLEKIIYHEGEQLIRASYAAKFKESYPEQSTMVLEAWVPSSNFCDIKQGPQPLLDCSRETIDMVKKVILEKSVSHRSRNITNITNK
ncbi:hypothetical protein [Scytonema sp. PRP1]|uniref:hypothetical protein n=1 Tax=Scytonema sp. PRP1 TaxID=3120513 RepID=UPI00300C1FF0